MTSQVSPHPGLKCGSTRDLTGAFPLRGKRPRFTLEGGLQPLMGSALSFHLRSTPLCKTALPRADQVTHGYLVLQRVHTDFQRI